MITWRFFSLQFLQQSTYSTLSNKNRIKLSFFPAIRGAILDRNNNKLAHTKFFYNIILSKESPQKVSHTMKTLAKLGFKIPEKTQEKIFSAIPAVSDFVLLKHLTLNDIKPLEANKIDLPSIYIEEIYERHYPAQYTFHITGYTKKTMKNNIAISTGKYGLEKIFNEELSGKIGYHELETNSLGKTVRTIKTSPSVNGASVKTSVDGNVSKVINDYFSNKIGAIVILNANTGEVLAMHSNPFCDSNKFITGFNSEDWQKIANDPNKPFLNRCIGSQYPMGSPFKLVTALAGLENNINPNKSYYCSGSYKVGRREFKCNNRRGHGHLKMDEAIARSCNVYFYRISQDIGINNIYKTAVKLGLGSKTGIELEDEKAGNIPNKKWKIQQFNEDWMLGDTANASIGQGFILATPLQMSLMTARIATGKNIQPTILFKPNNDNVNLSIDSSHLEIIRRGMMYSVNKPWGGSRYAKINKKHNATMYGKTGTAQVVSLESANKIDDHAIFTGFVKTNSNSYAISVVAEHKSWGSRNAAPIARNIFNKLFDENLIS